MKKFLLSFFMLALWWLTSHAAETWTKSQVQEGSMPAGWVTSLGTGGIWGTDLWLGGAGAYVEYTFTGTKVRILGLAVDSTSGEFALDGIECTGDIFIDGNLVSDNDKSWIKDNADIPDQLIWTSGVLAAGSHTIKVLLNGKEMGINAIEYVEPVVLPEPELKLYVSNEITGWGATREKLVDGNLSSKWAADGLPAWIVFKYADAKTWDRYALTSGGDVPGRDLKDWTLTASNDSVNWVTLDTQVGHPIWEARNSTLKFDVTNSTAYTYYKFDITANNGQSATQLSEIEFMVKPAIVPDSVVGVDAVAYASNYVSVNWTATAITDGYTVWRQDGLGGSWTELGDVTVNKYNDVAVTPETNYIYKIVAWNNVGDAAASTNDTVTTPNTTNEHTLKVEVISGWNLIQAFKYFDGAEWKTVAYNSAAILHNFKVHGAGFLESETAGKYAQLTFKGTQVQLLGKSEGYGGTGKAYFDGVYQKDISFNGSLGDNALIYEKSTLLLPDSVVGIEAIAYASNRVVVNWTIASNADGYTVWRQDGFGGSWAELGDVSTNSYNDLTVTAEIDYIYKIVAWNGVGDASSSVNDTVTTPDATNEHTLKVEVISGWNLINAFKYFDGSEWKTVAYNSPAIMHNFGVHVAGFLESETAGKYAQFTFKGTKVQLLGKSEGFGGTGKAYFDGVYQKDISFNGSLGSNALIYEKSALPPQLPDSVVGFVASSTVSNKVELIWTDNNNAIGYKIMRKVAEVGNFASIATITDSSIVAYTDSIVTAATKYVYHIIAYNNDGDAAASVNDTVTTPAALVVPDATTNFTAVAKSFNEVELKWTQTPNADGYKILRKTGAGAFDTDSVINDVTVVSYTDVTVAPSTEYTYKIIAYNNIGDASATEVVVTTLAQPEYVITVSDEDLGWGETREKLVDGNLNNKWSCAGSTSFIQIQYLEAKTWDKYALTSGNDLPERDFKSWALKASNNGTDWTTLDTQTDHATWAQRNSTLEFQFANTTAYTYYKIDILNNHGANRTQLSELEFSAKPVTVPDSVEGVDAVAYASNYVAVSWTATENADGYTVWRKDGLAGSWAELGDVTVNKYSDLTVFAETDFIYKIVAFNNVGDASASANDTVTTPNATNEHTIRIEVIGGWNLIQGYKYLDGSEWKTVAYNSPAILHNFNVHGAGFLEANVAGKYAQFTFKGTRVQLLGKSEGYGGTGNAYFDGVYQQDISFNGSLGSNAIIYEKSALPPQLPDSVVGFVASSTVSDKVEIIWADNNNALGYKIMRKVAEVGDFTLIKTINDSTIVAYTDATVTPNTKYVYNIIAFNYDGDAVASVNDTVTTPEALVVPNATTNFTAVAKSFEVVELKWTQTPNANGYKLSRKTGTGAFDTDSVITDITVVSLIDETVAPATEYTYKIIAYNNVGDAPATEVVVTTPAEPALIVTASDDNPQYSESIDKLTDGNINSKWSTDANTATIQFKYKDAQVLKSYSITSANNIPGRDFKTWTVKASNNAIDWVTLDNQVNHDAWAQRYQTLHFNLNNVTAYKYYMFDVTANQGDGFIQIAEIKFNDFVIPPYFVNIDNLNSAWTWNNFTEDTDGKQDCLGGSQHASGGIGDIAECTFKGSYIEVYGEMWDGAPVIEIFIDGVSKGDFSQKKTGGDLVSGLFAAISGLTEGSHVAKFVTKGKSAGIDYIKAYTTTKPPVAPNATQGVTAKFQTPNVLVEWLATDTADGYVVARKEGTLTTVYTPIDTLIGKNETSYLDTKALPNKKYYYIIFAFNAYGVAPKSEFAVINVPAEAEMVKGLTATSTVYNRVALKWTVTGSTDGYNVYRKSAGAFALIGKVAESSTNVYTDTTVVGATEYTYKVAAFNIRGEGVASVEVNVTTPAKEGGTAIDNNNLATVNMYPNPVVNGTLNVKSVFETSTITITDILGKLVYTNLLVGNNNTVNVQTLQNGIYFVNINSNGKNYNSKVVIK